MAMSCELNACACPNSVIKKGVPLLVIVKKNTTTVVVHKDWLSLSCRSGSCRTSVRHCHFMIRGCGPRARCLVHGHARDNHENNTSEAQRCSFEKHFFKLEKGVSSGLCSSNQPPQAELPIEHKDASEDKGLRFRFYNRSSGGSMWLSILGL